MCSIITSIWCLWFEVELTASNGYDNDIVSQCKDEYYGYDIMEKTWINYNLTEVQVEQLDGTNNQVYSPPTNDSYGDDVSVSARFIISVILSYVIGVLFWQPIIILAKSAYKLIKIERNPNKFNEAILFYHPKNFVHSEQIRHASTILGDEIMTAVNLDTNDSDAAVQSETTDIMEQNEDTGEVVMNNDMDIDESNVASKNMDDGTNLNENQFLDALTPKQEKGENN